MRIFYRRPYPAFRRADPSALGWSSRAAAKALFLRPYETHPQRKLWYALAFTGHGAAAFDAWSTRRAISGNYGTESNRCCGPSRIQAALCGYAG